MGLQPCCSDVPRWIWYASFDLSYLLCVHVIDALANKPMDLACAIGAVQASVRAPNFLVAPIFRAGQNVWIVSWLSLTLFTNAYATGTLIILNLSNSQLTIVGIYCSLYCWSYMVGPT